MWRQLDQNHTVNSRLVGNTNKPIRSRTGTVQDNIVKHLHAKTELYYDLFDVATFPAARSVGDAHYK